MAGKIQREQGKKGCPHEDSLFYVMNTFLDDRVFLCIMQEDRLLESDTPQRNRLILLRKSFPKRGRYLNKREAGMLI